MPIAAFAEALFHGVTSVISGVFVKSVQCSAETPDGADTGRNRTGGSSGYDHPSPSIPLPVEGRGKPVATRPASWALWMRT